ncbi:DUF1198 family protein [Halomonas sp. QX-2]|uniref:DUF1198 family protein n=1 Tax=Vreelandella sedimenti TaxID=2729618 RepID=A0A7Z0SPX1_9GAMM|nr:DUF1198 family protein [Halomonas sedimenti]NYT74406.1 DUF1198 family protein [Halomonas sedimenti]|tara:strand:- start:205 stop:621 length:417 start_codon:yes stop_codon:yes gene_type:complete
MTWYILIGVVVVLFFGYKLTTAKPRKAANIIALSLGIKRQFVDNMLSAMGPERGRLFVQNIVNWGDKDNCGVYTFVVYQIMKNDSEQNIKWWKSKLIENNIDPKMEYSKAEAAFAYLKDSGADRSQIDNFIGVYNSIS